MKLGTKFGIAAAGIFLVFASWLLLQPTDRIQREKFVVGTWYNAGFEMAHQPIVLHIFDDHTYRTETSSYHIQKAGKWSISGFPDHGHLILEAYHIATDTHSDGKITLDLASGKMSDPFGSNFIDHKYVKEPDELRGKLTASENFALGGWTNNLKWDDSSHRTYYFISDHRFNIEFESDGKWRIEGSKIILDWIDDEDQKRHSAIIKMNQAGGNMIEPSGRSLTRIKTSN